MSPLNTKQLSQLKVINELWSTSNTFPINRYCTAKITGTCNTGRLSSISLRQTSHHTCKRWDFKDSRLISKRVNCGKSGHYVDYCNLIENGHSYSSLVPWHPPVYNTHISWAVHTIHRYPLQWKYQTTTKYPLTQISNSSPSNLDNSYRGAEQWLIIDVRIIEFRSRWDL